MIVLMLQISREREENLIDKALLKEIVDMYVELGMGELVCYENDFEDAMLVDAADYYSRKASQWIVEDSCPHYMTKVSSLTDHFFGFRLVPIIVSGRITLVA